MEEDFEKANHPKRVSEASKWRRASSYSRQTGMLKRMTEGTEDSLVIHLGKTKR
jgi:hypothetical protein